MAGGWSEYLQASSERLRAARAAIDLGTPLPPAPSRPTAPVPTELRDDARRLAAGYDQLAAEVSSRLASIGRHRRAYATERAATVPHYLDQHL